MNFYGRKPYVSVAKRREQAQKLVKKSLNAGKSLDGVPAFKGAIAKSFWGKGWCTNLESFSDYSNRLPRGRSYVRNGAVIDLIVKQGSANASVMGSSLYKVEIKVATINEKKWKALCNSCVGSIDSLIEILNGKLSSSVMTHLCQPRLGLFPQPNEIKFSCSCPDWASMCKHVAAALYAVGARLDLNPQLLFALRDVNPEDLLANAGATLTLSEPGETLSVTLGDSLADIFEIDMDETPTSAKKNSNPLNKIKKQNKKRIDGTASNKAPPKVDLEATKKVLKKATNPDNKISTKKSTAKKISSKQVTSKKILKKKVLPKK